MNLTQVLTWIFIITFILAFFFPVLWIPIIITILIYSFVIYVTVRIANINARCHEALQDAKRELTLEGKDYNILEGVTLNNYRRYYERSDYTNNYNYSLMLDSWVFDTPRDYYKDEHGIEATCFTYKDYEDVLIRGIIGINNNSALFFGATTIKLEYNEVEDAETFLAMEWDPILISKYYGIDINT